MIEARPSVLVVVVAYRSDDLLEQCLAELDDSLAITVIDNSPSDGTQALVARHGATYVRSETNVGFAAAVNRALEHSWDGVSDVLLLNPDARITPAQIELLRAALHATGSHLAAVGPRLVGPEGEPRRSSWPMPSPVQVWLDALGCGRLWTGRRFVTGASLLLNGAAIAELGTLDERYFLYAEEADWQLRALRAGWDVKVVDFVEVVHVGGASSSDGVLRARLAHASAQLFAQRWYSGFGAAVMRAGTAVGVWRRWLTSPRNRAENREALRAAWSGGGRARP